MAIATGHQRRIEFGDYQTPSKLAAQVCRVLLRRRIKPASIVEPTCGTGTFLTAALNHFPAATRYLGFEINRAYARKARSAVAKARPDVRCDIRTADFFQTDWSTIVGALPDPILVLGNPPWVTSAAIGSFQGENLPTKSNSDSLPGVAALTGKSNFDISEWMIWHLLERLGGNRATLAMLCKTAVARRVLSRVWKSEHPLRKAEVHHLDAATYFGAAVRRLPACLFNGAIDLFV